MDEFSYLSSLSPESFDEMYKQYKNDPESIDSSWRKFFQGFEFSQKSFIPTPDAIPGETFDKEFNVINLINGYRKRGHLFTNTNPVRTRRQYTPTLDLENYGLSDIDLDTEFHAGKEIGIGVSKLKDILSHLNSTYCKAIGSEYMFIRKPDKIEWLQKKIESSQNRSEYSSDEKKQLFYYLVQAAGFEGFIHNKFTGQKRFSLEGTEAIIPALQHVIEIGAMNGIEDFVFGMAHRGRLNVLGNILQKPYENIFNEFIAEQYEDSIALGDVKYHLGYDSDVTTTSGKKVNIHLAPNPSHLETVTPIIQGISRAIIGKIYKDDLKKVIPIIIHGDAAIAGQGVVYEVIQMSELEGYRTGGTIHFVVNNQIGFTTNYLDARTSTYCTDIGKVTKAPIFHVNGDDVEALIHTVKLAIEYRQTFHSDVFIDILSYRKYGHNEGDEPRFTQPLLYKAIANHPNPRDIYAKKLVEDGVMTEENINTAIEDFNNILEEKLEKAKKITKTSIKQFLNKEWKNYIYPEATDFTKINDTTIDENSLQRLSEKINHLPDDKNFLRKTTKLIQDRKDAFKEDRLDWAMGELLAYASLLDEDVPIRISGQDSIRGTFAHRHAAHTISDSDQSYVPLKYIKENQPSFDIFNSPLNEYGVLGFEYGYALARPRGLTIWEAQFGDFVNVAQVIIDQYLSSGEEKWGLMNGLVLYLPHGYEGQGPEHSSARIERFLSSSVRGNMQVLNITKPANLFHALRNHILRDFRIPMVIFTPKSLLRHPECVSRKDDFTKGEFTTVYDDDNVDINEVRRVVFCTGKIYYDLLAKKKEYNARDIALIRIEQLHPLPKTEIRKIKTKYYNAMLHLWVQEEPENMGAWNYIHNSLKDIDLVAVTRAASASPAVGLSKIHSMQQKEIIEKVFRKCDCYLQNVYCGLQCMVGKSRKHILKQHKYFQKPKVHI